MSLLNYRYEFCCHFTGDAGKVWSVCSVCTGVPCDRGALPHCTEEHSFRSLLNGIQSRQHIGTVFHLLRSVNSSLYNLSNLQHSASELHCLVPRVRRNYEFEKSFGSKCDPQHHIHRSEFWEFSSTSYLLQILFIQFPGIYIRAIGSIRIFSGQSVGQHSRQIYISIQMM